MPRSIDDAFLLDVWATRPDGQRVYPYKGERGAKKGLFSVNFTNDNKNFIGLTAEELVTKIESGAFCQRGTIRMLALDAPVGAERSAYAPVYLRGKRIRDTYCVGKI
jgi:hypothetical protein